ncbi:phosphoglycolate phosphatase [Acinetobacter qingfengensis]|uniref:phosphoglycolate phosphatase n=1 Tax=Acinetobacter qingfengensis TaxID=1262585 RepID=A0A1E7RDL0_9GAMM|nr:phosphoglycolate phosphatase [Acinetobacter qingfengensis]KAA8732346.1 phosphoglycolate phosphatase [Acinetobacter qingfengensis]OEY97255.1 phosphoglycolate phosphatase [Acinetobacter qingfengensis]
MHSLLDTTHRQLILFDLDGTLVDSARDLYRAMNLTLTDLGRPLVTESQVRVWIGKGASQLCACVIHHQDQYFDPEAHQQLLQHFLQIYQKNLCVDTTVYAGVLEFLQYCKAQNKTLVCVTNKPYQAAVELLRQINLLEYFSLVLGGDSLENRKPHPEPLLHAIEYFSQQKQNTLMIGDSRNDVEAARASGIDCIVLGYGYNHGEAIQACNPQMVIDNLQQLIPEQN